MAAPVVKFKRALYPPSHKGGSHDGSDVIAVKRAISRAGFWPWQEFDDTYSAGFANGNKSGGGVKDFQKTTGITPATGFYGSATHTALLSARVPAGSPHAGEWVWDQSAINLYNGFVDMTAAQQIVASIFGWWDWLVARNPDVHYLQARPVLELTERNNPPKIPMYCDCSGTTIYCAWLGGAISPDIIYGYSGYGNTDSLIKGGFQIQESEIAQYCQDYLVLSFYGESVWNTDHVTNVRSASQNYSHGKESDPSVYNTIHYRPDFLQLRAYNVI